MDEMRHFKMFMGLFGLIEGHDATTDGLLLKDDRHVLKDN
jgi:hypothetical protein